MKKTIVFLILIALFSCGTTDRKPIHKLSDSKIITRQDADLKAIKVYRYGLQAILKFVKKRTDLFPGKKQKKIRILTRDKRSEISITWKSLLDYYLALDSIDHYHRKYHLLPTKHQSKSYYVSKAAFYTKYRFALDFLAITDKDKTFDTIFNEKIPELGLSEDTYYKFKFKYLNVMKATQFAAFEATGKLYEAIKDKSIKAYIQYDSKRIWSFGKGRGEKMTLKNGLNILKTKGKDAWFPVQKGISDTMGDIKVYRNHAYLITKSQIENFTSELRPGDILLERREWYLSNIGIPGFWTHAAIYIGTPEEREQYFNDEKVKEWLAKRGLSNFEEHLKITYPQAYKKSLKAFDDKQPVRIIEAIGEGVLFTSMLFSASCDSLAVIRPRVSKVDKAIAISRAFKYSGRPYDFDFDFLTDATLVCTELVYKAYEPGFQTKGLHFSFESILGKKIVSANSIAKDFSKNNNNGKQQYDFILFYDGYEKQKKAYRADLKTFLSSWKRPKWHVLKQSIN